MTPVERSEGDQALVEEARAAIAALTRSVPDFPTRGVVFKDLTPVLADATAFAAVIAALSADAAGVDVVAGIDARGFLLGGAVAHRLGVGVVAVRKQGKLPPPVLSRSYELEYGTSALEIPAEALELSGKRVLVVDDVLATGGTIGAAAALLSQAGASVAAVAVVLELSALGGRGFLSDASPAPIPVRALATG
ncbi:adenine phosphoribosyltransferase [Gordonia araii NBRC 100433]|uniref:Adenine phosphoribosyltransferase n=1 Tax=Gordonia araii NBRC 100433 TaxID=1073574 RepID=G7H5F8_9ACTN|nr:adenine phosphoribosyltransferase [Gordonia araii]NNG95797.1 adenine phosphoribosyltransferase [Gordonia araii NBRC 100433]GAB11083.1 adenine phosphoribosyltransferase [Gordonia araii NBRC 100433]